MSICEIIFIEIVMSNAFLNNRKILSNSAVDDSFYRLRPKKRDND